jgi:hypothetical protein
MALLRPESVKGSDPSGHASIMPNYSPFAIEKLPKLNFQKVL